MADILKITTPLVNKNTVQSTKQPIDPSVPFNISDISKVIKPNKESELLSQNNGLLKEDAPAILMDMLKNPSATASFLSNILLIEDIVKLLPINNNPVTQEIERLFNSMLISCEDIEEELVKQEKSSTNFKGELFDFLRNLVAQHPSTHLEKSVLNLLKAIHSMVSKDDILDSLANNLEFLSTAFGPSKNLSLRFIQLSEKFREPDAEGNFTQLKKELMQLISDAGESILLTPRVAKALPLLIYNLSRFNDNADFIKNAASELMTQLDSREEKQLFSKLLGQFLIELGATNHKGTGSGSGIMDTIANIIKISQNEEDAIITSESTEKIIQSLLSSPCNFTPLLHYVLPVEYMGAKAFAEMWLDPDDLKSNDSEYEPRHHMLIVFDIEGIGSFEVEIIVVGKEISMAVMCPERYKEEFSQLQNKFPKIIEASGYKLSEIRIDSLKKQRSLMEVFKDLPYRRTGVDVKI